jgi:beta-fructofuranosidase
LLVVSVVDRAPNVRPAHVVAFAGRMIGDRFVVRRAQRLGLGPDFYAPAATRLADGRYLMFGWIPEDPPDAGSARSWAGSMTLPRIVTLDPDGSASISLAAEIGRVPGRRQRFSDQRLDDGGTWSHIFDEPYVEWRTSLDPDSASSVRIDIEGPSGLEAELRYEPLERRLTISRMGRVSVAGRDPHGSAVLPPGRDDERIDLWIVIDGTVIELAANDVITAAVRRPDAPGGCRLTVTALGGAADLFDTETTQF